jgi:SPW repeat-containing protein
MEQRRHGRRGGDSWRGPLERASIGMELVKSDSRNLARYFAIRFFLSGVAMWSNVIVGIIIAALALTNTYFKESVEA